MRKRDLAILMLCAFAILFALQHEGDFSFREAWFHLAEDYPVKYEGDRLPPPIVADLNGDGKSEVLVATQDAKIQVLDPHAPRISEGFGEAKVIAEVSLLPDKIRVSSGRRAVAMATGFIEQSFTRGPAKKMVLVVVTSGWLVMCFNHNLEKMWEVNLQDDFPHGAHHREVSISISNYTLRHGDTGLVIVGGRMEIQPHMYMDPFEELGNDAAHAERQRRNATEKDSSERSGIVDLRHFAIYAFAGSSGSLRWSRKNENIESEKSDASQLIPQHNYKLDVQSMNSPRPGEHECRDFRESILGILPHHWDRREDTVLKLAHFKRHKRKTIKKIQGRASTFPHHKPEEHNPPGKDPTKRISKIIGKAADYATSSKNKKLIQYVPTITNYTKLWWVPNVVVSHEKEGIEVLHLVTGRTLCKLHLPQGGLHADINNDGVVDHIQAVGGERTVMSGSMDVIKPCWAVATSGVPVREHLFNVSLCHYSPLNLFQHAEFQRHFGRNSDGTALEVATPVFVRKQEIVVFLTSRGEVTAYTPTMHGHGAVWQWKVMTEATWTNLPSPTGMMEMGQVVPTLKAFSLGGFDDNEVILVAGDQAAEVISAGGSVQTVVYLPAAPTHAVVCEDFSNDGLTDLIVMTGNGVYGFVQTRTPGAIFFSTLVGCLIVVMGVIFVSQHLSSMKGKPRPSLASGRL